ncbi:hypothetical protein FACS189447_05860 [Spirochaetia bacterium]|nr:hypothetical protein FACS189447_05860 [Spirochaetia bacterium]
MRERKAFVSRVLGFLFMGTVLVFGLLSCKGKDVPASASGTDDMSKEYTYSFAMLNWGQLRGTDFVSDELAQHFQKKFNFKWDVTVTSWADWVEKPRIWINSNDMPDMVFTNFNFKDYISWLDQGLIKRLPEGWKETYPYLATVWNNTILGPALEEKAAGNPGAVLDVIFFSKPTSPKISSHMSVFFRKDWAAALGFEIKDAYTLKEFTAMIDKFMAQGSSLPGVTRGKVDTWSIETDNAVNLFVNHQWADSTRFYKNASGKYVWGLDDPRTFELVQNMKSAIQRGVVSPNFASFKNQEEDDFFYTGQAFATYTNGWIGHVYTDWRKFQDSTGLDPFECIQETTIIDADGNYQGYEELNFFSALFFSPNMDDAKMTRLLKILDYVASPEGQSYVRMGFEGKDYTKNGDTITITREKDASGNFVEIYDKYPGSGIYSHMTICADNYEVTNPAVPQSYHNVVRTMYGTRQKLGVDTGTLKDYNWELYFFEGPNYLKFNTSIGEELIRVAMLDGDLKTNYDRWLREMRPVVDPVLAELNAAYGN